MPLGTPILCMCNIVHDINGGPHGLTNYKIKVDLLETNKLNKLTRQLDCWTFQCKKFLCHGYQQQELIQNQLSRNKNVLSYEQFNNVGQF